MRGVAFFSGLSVKSECDDDNVTSPLHASAFLDRRSSPQHGFLTAPNHLGQMNMYLNYYGSEDNDEDDKSPIGIVLCTDKHEVMAEFALGGLANTIFASRYTYYIPNKEQLIHEVKALLQSEETE